MEALYNGGISGCIAQFKNQYIMEEEKKFIEMADDVTINVTMSGSDMKLILTSLMELPAKFSRDLINRLEVVMMSQLKKDG